MERSKKFLKLAVFGIQVPMFLIEVVPLKRRGAFFVASAFAEASADRRGLALVPRDGRQRTGWVGE